MSPENEQKFYQAAIERKIKVEEDLLEAENRLGILNRLRSHWTEQDRSEAEQLGIKINTLKEDLKAAEIDVQRFSHD